MMTHLAIRIKDSAGVYTTNQVLKTYSLLKLCYAVTMLLFTSLAAMHIWAIRYMDYYR